MRRSQRPRGAELRVLCEVTVCVYVLFNQEKCHSHLKSIKEGTSASLPLGSFADFHLFSYSQSAKTLKLTRKSLYTQEDKSVCGCVSESSESMVNSIKGTHTWCYCSTVSIHVAERSQLDHADGKPACHQRKHWSRHRWVTGRLIRSSQWSVRFWC